MRAIVSLPGFVSLTLVCLVFQCSPTVAQVDVFGGGGFRIVRGMGGVPGIRRATSENAEEVVGAVLKTDPDLEALLEKANRHASDGNFRVATRLWQAVLERSGDSLYSKDDKVFFSIADQVEQLLAELPADALEIYRVTADASAKQILNSANNANNVAALMKVASNHFISSVGDDAAFRLGCLYLDRHDFSGALRMFRKIATQHPDPSISLDEVHARIAICHAMMGNRDLARKALDTGRGYGADSSAVDTVERSLAGLSPTDARNASMEQWLQPHGNQRRMSAMPALPESSFTRDQVACWSYYFEPRNERYLVQQNTIGRVLVGSGVLSEKAAESRNPLERRIIKTWSEGGLRPAGHLLFDDQQIIYKAAADVIAFDRKRINESINSDIEPESTEANPREFATWRSIWRNVFEVDSATMQLNSLLQNIGSRGFGRSRRGQQVNSTDTGLGIFARSMHFDDLIYHQMAIHDDVLYSIEGKAYNERSQHPASRVQRHAWNYAFRRTRDNFLSAYEKDSGRMLWRIPRINKPESPGYDPSKNKSADEQDDRWLRSGGMMAAPVKFADLLIVPVNQAGSIHLYGIDPSKEGQTVWNSFLCDEPESGSVATAPINLTIDGSDLFVTCGTGVVFVVDPTTGKIRFAKRYTRKGQPNEILRNYNSSFTKYDGWSSDTVLPNGRELICLCSDSDTIEAIDRNDGSMIWRTGLRPYGTKVDYIIGVWNDLLYLGGQRTIIAIDLKAQGYIAWGGEPLFEDAVTTGRGMVTPQGVFVPVGNSIWRFALDGKEGRAHVLNQVEAFLGTEAPVGNLYSDGERIWVHGTSRLYALSPKED